MTPENRFIQRVHARLDDRVHAEKTNNPYRRGTPDVYYEGDAGCLWVEYKYLKTPPRRAFTPGLSELQRRWLARCHSNGHLPWVVVGTPEGGYLLEHPEHWVDQVKTHEVELYSIKDIRAEIERRCVRIITP